MKTVQLIEPDSKKGIGSPLDLLKRCGGYYECPKNAEGKRLGPLVGYAGKDAVGRQYVGDIYANFAKIERHAPILKYVADQLVNAVFARRLEELFKSSTGFCAAPEGGKALACQLAQVYEPDPKQYIFLEKETTAVATSASRETSKLKFDRHEPESGEIWWIAEDVCNNFSTTSQIVSLIEEKGASVAGILCFLNRSMAVRSTYSPREGLVLPVIALVDKPFDQFGQDDPFVAEDIRASNVVWKPKKKEEWAKLVSAMTKTGRY